MEKTKWILSIDDFDDGKGEQEYPHCHNCGRGVYKRDAGNYCPFCGTYMGLNKKLTDRQVKLINDFLATCEGYRTYYEHEYGNHERKTIIFNGIVYKILEVDYKEVCEIIDYIKGVKK